ncbi:MAG TPA: hypothetical protein VFS88_00980 [Micavibrio sp.]|nr:hypothetical protein [Micavibrio sp.]
MSKAGLNESRFNMWRAVATMAHADSIVRPHEVHFILENTKDLPLTEAQRERLAFDLRSPSSMQTVFGKITSPRDKEDFFHFARALCWSDGDFDESEQSLLNHLHGLSLTGDEKRVMKYAMAHFNEIYIEGNGQVRDPGFMAMIRTMIGKNAA